MSASDSARTEPRGWVYVILNDDTPGKFKIGYTTKDPIDRALEFVSTGTTGTFVVIYHALVANPFAVEQEVHKRLRLDGIDCEREWFSVCPDRAKEEIRTVAGTVFYEDTTARWHRSQRRPKAYVFEVLAEAKAAAEEQRRLKAEREEEERLLAEGHRLLRELEVSARRLRQIRENALEKERLQREEDERKAEEAAKREAEAELIRQEQEERERQAAILAERLQQEREKRAHQIALLRAWGKKAAARTAAALLLVSAVVVLVLLFQSLGSVARNPNSRPVDQFIMHATDLIRQQKYADAIAAIDSFASRNEALQQTTPAKWEALLLTKIKAWNDYSSLFEKSSAPNAPVWGIRAIRAQSEVYRVLLELKGLGSSRADINAVYYKRAVGACNAAIQKSSSRLRGEEAIAERADAYHELGRVHQAYARVTGNIEFTDQAVSAYRKALDVLGLDQEEKRQHLREDIASAEAERTRHNRATKNRR